MRSYTRRGFLGLAAAGAGAAAFSALGRVPGDSLQQPESATRGGRALARASDVDRRPVPPAIARRRRAELALMEGTRYATPATIAHSGLPGPVVMVLGGVHGNEPGGWLAAEAMAAWEVERGTFIVLPRINHLSADEFQRTLPDFGDLNRVYPGDPAGLPMERMAYEIVALARRYGVTHLFDLHESWGFFRERAPGNNSVSSELGQLVVAGGDDTGTATMQAAADGANLQVADREQFTVVDRHHPDWTWIGLGRSSISLATYIEGCTPVLIETGQDGQPEARRAELHQVLIAGVLDELGMTGEAATLG